MINVQAAGLEPGTIGEWVGAFTGTIFGIAALFVALAANRVARRANDQAIEFAARAEAREREREKRDRDREMRDLAGGLQGWWARSETGSTHPWGVVLANVGTASLSFFDVRVTVSRGDATPNQLKVDMLPPGMFFFAQNSAGETEPASGAGKFPWKLPQVVHDSRDFHPILSSSDFRVNRIDFTDPIGNRWRWERENGLTLLHERAIATAAGA